MRDKAFVSTLDKGFYSGANIENCFAAAVATGKTAKVIEWMYCRDEFYEDWKHAPSDYVVYKPPKAAFVDPVIAFLNFVEKKLDLPARKRMRIQSLNGCVIIRPGIFWAQSLRMSLLTLLMRCGRHYDAKKKNWVACLGKSKYLKAKKVMYAARRFLRGHCELGVEIWNTLGGWRDTFIKRKKKWIDSVLLKTKAEK